MNVIAQWIDQWLIPIWIVFFVIIVGYLIGKIKVRGISLGISAILIFSLIVGVLLDSFPAISIGNSVVFHSSEWQETMHLLSPLGTALFLSAVGISSGNEFAKIKQKYRFRYFSIGALTVITNFILVKILFLLDGKLDESFLYGVFCGAMTSSPGLAALCEISSQFALRASSGYGGSYFFGVVGVVLFVQLLSGKSSNQKGTLKYVEEAPSGSPALFGLIQISIVVLLGTMLGAFMLPMTRISFGTSGGILICGIILGYWIQKRRPKKVFPQKFTELYRTLGLILFFVGNGIPSGMRLREFFEPYVIVYGLLLTSFPLIFTYCLCRFALKQDKRTTLSIICGSMTSTPAFGVLSQSGRATADLSVYTSSYIGALIAMVALLNFFV